MWQWIVALASAFWSDPITGRLIDVLTLIVLIGTLYWARKYTQVTQQIYAASYRPEVVLDITQVDQGPGRPGIRDIAFRNIGVGNAFGVQMKDWKKGDWLVRWDDPLDVLEKGQTKRAVFFASRDGKSGGFARDTVDLNAAIADNPGRETEKLMIPFEITYRDSAGTLHSTTGRLEYNVVSGLLRPRYTFS